MLITFLWGLKVKNRRKKTITRKIHCYFLVLYMLIWSFFFSYTEFIAKFMSFYKISVTNNKSIQHDDDHKGASLISLSHTHSEIWSFLAENHMWQYCLYRLRFLYITQTDWTIFLNKYMHNYVIKMMSWERYCALICSAYIYIYIYNSWVHHEQKKAPSILLFSRWSSKCLHSTKHIFHSDLYSSKSDGLTMVAHGAEVIRIWRRAWNLKFNFCTGDLYSC